MSRRLPFGSDAVAQVALTGLFDELLGEIIDGREGNGAIVAREVLAAASVEYRPNARKLVLTFDLSESAPASAVPAGLEGDDEVPQQCGYISLGRRCVLMTPHKGIDHDLEQPHDQ